MANELIKTNSNVIEAADNYNPNFGNIRSIIVDEEVWLCGLDVCDVLGYADAPKILKYHVKEAERKKFPISSHGQNRKMVVNYSMLSQKGKKAIKGNIKIYSISLLMVQESA